MLFTTQTNIYIHIYIYIYIYILYILGSRITPLPLRMGDTLDGDYCKTAHRA